MKKKLLNSIDLFIEKYYPEIDGILLFGSSTNSSGSPNDIDLLLTDHKLPYYSKEVVNYNFLKFNIIKVPTQEIFNLLALDYKDGIYLNILKSGFILRDYTGIITTIKNYIENKYPENTSAIKQKINVAAYNIYNYKNLVFEEKNPPLNAFMLFSSLVNNIVDFILLSHGKLHFKDPKQKSRYFHHHFFPHARKIWRIVQNFNSGETEKTKIELEALIDRIGVPIAESYSSDFIMSSIDEKRNVFFIEGTKNKQTLSIVSNSNLKNNSYIYFVDINNIESFGTYIVCKTSDKNHLDSLKDNLKKEFLNQQIYFPYNLNFFHPVIKYGNEKNLECVEAFFIQFQKLITDSNWEEPKLCSLIIEVIESLNISITNMKEYYLYKIINENHSLNYKNLISDKEKLEEELIKNDIQCKPYCEDIHENEIEKYKSQINQMKSMDKRFKIQFINQLFSMLFLSDREKLFYIYSFIKNTSNV